MIRIPQQLADAVDQDDDPARAGWLSGLPGQIDEIASGWSLELDEPYEPGGQCAWVAPARNRAGDELVLKVSWRHREAEHEADALRLWDGSGAVRCMASRALGQSTALLLERCAPGSQLKRSLPEPEQDVVVARLLRRLWEHRLPQDHPFGSLQEICDEWAESFEAEFDADDHGLDPGLAREGLTMLRELPRTADRSVLLCVDLHAENILAAQREPWLVIDPKPFVGDPAFDAVQHMLNCDERLATDPAGLSVRMASLLEVDPERVRLWLFARAVQESLDDVRMRGLARRIAK
jgi:streptomycin 6-kinase